MGMSFLDIANTELPPLILIPESEVKLEVVKAVEKVYKSGREGWMIILRSNDHPNASNIFDNIFQPMEGDADNTERMMVERAQAFAKSFNIASDDVSDWAGAAGWAKVSVEKDDTTGEDRNTIGRYLAPR